MTHQENQSLEKDTSSHKRGFLHLWIKMGRLFRRFRMEPFLFVFSLGVATFLGWWLYETFGAEDKAEKVQEVLLVLVGLLFVCCLILTLIARRLVLLRGPLSGGRLHVRIILLFSFVTALPAILLFIFSIFYLNFGIQNWLSKESSSAVRSAQKISESYADSLNRSVLASSLLTAQDLERQESLLERKLSEKEIQKSGVINTILERELGLRNLDEIALLGSQGQVYAAPDLLRGKFQASIPQTVFLQAKEESTPILLSKKTDPFVGFLIHLPRYKKEDIFLYTKTEINEATLAQIKTANKLFIDYQKLKSRSRRIQVLFAMLFFVIALSLILLVIWLGVLFASYIVKPIFALRQGAREIGAGNLDVRVDLGQERYDELSDLVVSFNNMADQLQGQQDQLVKTHKEADKRRLFIETVLSGVSAGIIGLDDQGRIQIANERASEILGFDLRQRLGNALLDDLPHAQFLFNPEKSEEQTHKHEFVWPMPDGRIRNLRIELSRASGQQVVTIDDMTDLISAERKAAWGGIARRIAHEIKNPLTPIQLAAERLRRRYRGQITEDPETFDLCLDTIIRHVGNIGNMVDEFSAFARMPKPSFQKTNISDMIKEVVFLQRQAHENIHYEVKGAEGTYSICDRGQLIQVLTNLLKNSAESLNESPDLKGEVLVIVSETETDININIVDNGKGLDRERKESLLEPYVTTKAKGTGLGLAIVRKIIQEHGGDFFLRDRRDGQQGACALLTIKKNPLTEENLS